VKNNKFAPINVGPYTCRNSQMYRYAYKNNPLGKNYYLSYCNRVFFTKLQIIVEISEKKIFSIFYSTYIQEKSQKHLSQFKAVSEQKDKK